MKNSTKNFLFASSIEIILVMCVFGGLYEGLELKIDLFHRIFIVAGSVGYILWINAKVFLK